MCSSYSLQGPVRGRGHRGRRRHRDGRRGPRRARGRRGCRGHRGHRGNATPVPVMMRMGRTHENVDT